MTNFEYANSDANGISIMNSQRKKVYKMLELYLNRKLGNFFYFRD